MALIFTEGFDRTYLGSELTNGLWTTPSGSTMSWASGRFGIGAASNCVMTNYLNMPTRTLPANVGEFYVGFAVLASATVLEVDIYDSGTSQLRLIQRGSTLEVNHSVTTVLVTSAANTIPTSGWFYLEIGAKIHPSTGWVTVKVNGVTIATVSNVNTTTSSNNYVNSIGFNAVVDDMYFCDATTGAGAHPNNTFLGDKRVATIFPSSIISTQFTHNPVDVSAGYLIEVEAWIYANKVNLCSPLDNGLRLAPVYEQVSNATDCHYGSSPKMAASGYITSMTFRFRDYPSAKIRPVICPWDAVNQVPLGAYIYGNETVGLTAGNNTLTFPTNSAPVTKDVIYLFGFITDTTVIAYASDYSAGFTGVGTYASLPSTYVAGASAQTPCCAYTYSVDSMGAVSESGMNGDASYNSSSTATDTDLFGIASGLAAGSVIYGVTIKGEYALDGAGARNVINVAKSSTTTALGVAQALNTSYKTIEDIFVTDPNTSAAWTIANLNALQIGYKVDT